MAASAQRSVSMTIRARCARGPAGAVARARARCWRGNGSPSCAARWRASRADAVTVDALARLALAARRTAARCGCAAPRADLHALVAFAGLDDVLRG